MSTALPCRFIWIAMALLNTVTTTTARAADGDPADADFAAAVYARVAAASSGNVFLSPYSIRSALAMTAGGAAGQTLGQMDDVLRLPAGGFTPVDVPAGDGCRLDVANAVWAEPAFPFGKAFARRVTTAFGAEAHAADFAADPDKARGQINAWVAGHTHDKIKDLLPPGSVKADARLVLTNAVYFKGDWQTPFEARATRDGPFHLDAAHDAAVPTMHGEAGRMPVFQTDALSAVELPYRGGTVSMVVVIPKAVDGLAAVERGLSGDAVRQWVAGLAPTRALLSMPKFTATATVELNGVLSAMGMTDAFSRDRADFSAMVDSTDPRDRLFLSDVFHKAYVAVDEKGTEAAAATGVVMSRAMAARPQPTLVLEADRPFLYLLRDHQTGAVLFIGRCVDPRS